MAIVTGRITEHGAIIEVLVGVSGKQEALLTKHRMPVPDRIPVRAVIDTGASITGIVRAVPRRLNVDSFGTVSICTPSTPPDAPHECEEFDLSLSFVSGMNIHTLPSIHVIAPEDFTREEGLDALIGRDVLSRCNFEYFGVDRTFRLSF